MPDNDAVDEVAEYRKKPAFGMIMRKGETLYEAASRWHDEFDHAQLQQQKQIEALKQTIRPFCDLAEQIDGRPVHVIFADGTRIEFDPAALASALKMRKQYGA